MRLFRMTALAAVTASTMVLPAKAQVIAMGTGADGFPFGSVGTPYQQVYGPSDLASGARVFSAFEFFLVSLGGNLSGGAYNIFLSAASGPADGLGTTGFDSNRLGSNALFGAFALSAAEPSTLAFISAPFLYNLAANLLIDMRISGATMEGGAFNGANDGEAGGAYGRAPTFVIGFAGFWLQTESLTTPVTTTPEPTSIALIATGLLSVFGVARPRRRSVA